MCAYAVHVRVRARVRVRVRACARACVRACACACARACACAAGLASSLASFSSHSSAAWRCAFSFAISSSFFIASIDVCTRTRTAERIAQRMDGATHGEAAYQRQATQTFCQSTSFWQPAHVMCQMQRMQPVVCKKVTRRWCLARLQFLILFLGLFKF
eukprot:6208594-Pleurochrysis_carterae.AAC.2